MATSLGSMKLAAALVVLATAGCAPSFYQGPLPGAPQGATYAQVNGTRVRYVDSGGKGSPVVLLHGFASALETWNSVRPTLEKQHRVIALDLKGFGWTDRPPGDYSPRAQGLGELLFDLFYDQRSDEKMAFAFYDPSRISEEFVEDVDRALERPGTTAAALAAVRGQRYEDWQNRYSEVTAPALLLWGREDRVSPVDIGERLLRQLPNAELKVYPRCGHFPMIEAQSASTRDLAEFLKGDS